MAFFHGKGAGGGGGELESAHGMVAESQAKLTMKAKLNIHAKDARSPGKSNPWPRPAIKRPASNVLMEPRLRHYKE